VDTLRSSLAQHDVVNAGLFDMIFFGNELGNIFSDRIDPERRRVASSTANLVKDHLGTLSCIDIDSVVLNQIWANNTSKHFPRES
jgi:hypothetical protein